MSRAYLSSTVRLVMWSLFLLAPGAFGKESGDAPGDPQNCAALVISSTSEAAVHDPSAAPLAAVKESESSPPPDFRSVDPKIFVPTSVEQLLAMVEFPKVADFSPKNLNLSRALYNAFEGRDFYSGVPLDFEKFTVDHVVPKFLGGPDNYYNYVPTSGRINSLKGSELDLLAAFGTLMFIRHVMVPRISLDLGTAFDKSLQFPPTAKSIENATERRQRRRGLYKPRGTARAAGPIEQAWFQLAPTPAREDDLFRLYELVKNSEVRVETHQGFVLLEVPETLAEYHFGADYFEELELLSGQLFLQQRRGFRGRKPRRVGSDKQVIDLLEEESIDGAASDSKKFKLLVAFEFWMFVKEADEDEALARIETGKLYRIQNRFQ